MKLHQRLVTLGIRWLPDHQKLLGYECQESLSAFIRGCQQIPRRRASPH